MEAVHTDASSNATIMLKVIIGALVAAALFWIIESFVDVLFVYQHDEMHNWLIPHDTNMLLHRILVIILFLAFGTVNGLATIKSRRLEMQLRERDELDSLTRIYNRRMAMTFLEKEMHRSKRYKEKIGRKDPAVIMFAIDHFKKVNGKYGHNVGDLVLTSVSEVVKNNIRNADILARFGEEDFMIIATETNMEGAKILAEKVRHTIEQHNFEVVDRVTVSIGLSVYKNDDTLDYLVKRANKALYNAKKAGRNRVEVSD
jgi:diguanylate cyclase (GGDEF)-like protein